MENKVESGENVQISCVKEVISLRKRRTYYRDYGINEEEMKKIRAYCLNLDEKESALLQQVCEETNPFIAEQLYESLTEKKSYEKIDVENFIHLNREDFYGYQRLAVAKFHRILILTGESISEKEEKRMRRSVENSILFFSNEQQAVAKISLGSFKRELKKLAAERPEECRILSENKDGCIVVQIPREWLKIKPPKKLSKKQLKAIRKKEQEKRNKAVLA